MPTKNYNFTYIDDSKQIDIAGDTKKFLDEIDSQMKKNDDSIQDIFPIGADDIAANSIDSSKIVNLGIKTEDIADGAVTSEKLADDAVSSDSIAFKSNSVDASFLRDGTVTAEKLSDTGLDALVGGITIRYFDNQDGKADNVGMDKVGDSNWRVRGFYIPAFGVVVVTDFQKMPAGTWPGNKYFSLPSYIPKTGVDNKYCGCAIKYTSSSDFDSFAYLWINENSGIEPSTASDSHGYIMSGAIVFRVQGNSNTASLQNYEEANGVI